MRAALYRVWVSARARSLVQYLDGIERSQWLPRDEVRVLQYRKLRALLKHAGRHVPYYRELFRREGFDPGQARLPEDLTRLPVLDRETLARRWDDLRSERPGRGQVARSTGGSTGRALSFLVDRHELATRSAHIYRSLRWLGWDLGGRIAFVWGSDIDAKEHSGWMGRARDSFAGVRWIDAFRLEERNLDAHLDHLARFDPSVIVGYPSSLHLLARRAAARNGPVRLRGIETSAEMLAPHVREELARVFGCVVLDRYGCREAGVIAHECRSGGMHVNSESVVVECPAGEVLLTTLNNFTMPLIRYRNEDMAEMTDASCPCGRGLPLMRSIEGRTSDVIRSPAGRLIHGEFFTHLFYGQRGVRQFQVRQVRTDRLEIRVVSDTEFTEDARHRIETAIRDHADAGFEVAWIPVLEIPTGASRKFRFTISDIEEPRPGAGTKR